MSEDPFGREDLEMDANIKAIHCMPALPEVRPDPPTTVPGVTSESTWWAHWSLCARVWGNQNTSQIRGVSPEEMSLLEARAAQAPCITTVVLRKGCVGMRQMHLWPGWQLALAGKRVLLFDLDSQSPLTKTAPQPNLDTSHNTFLAAPHPGRRDYKRFLHNLPTNSTLRRAGRSWCRGPRSSTRTKRCHR
eukprot:TRINITY_DN70248_c0_g1_i1.p1 TRINITY_DN70248_c0_g1~~TRINITY_DN70248_c0_g1_i1.p1  ORF type:complete len:190 (+),score=0.48 TRINITY_DN70248_c0_g1_i1:189-758(+)